MSLLQRTEVSQNAHHKHVAFRPSDVSEVTETDEDVLIIDVSDDILERAVAADVLILNLNVPDDVLERAAVVTEAQVTTIGICTHWYQCGWPL